MTGSGQRPLDHRIEKYVEVAEKMRQGDFDVEIPITPLDEIGQLGRALDDLARTLHNQYDELERLDEITTNINSGLLLDETLENIYESFQSLIPYNRIGLALIEDNGMVVRSRWSKSDQPVTKIDRGYAGAMRGSSLESIMETGEPRIINDLEAYLAEKPQSRSTRDIVAEGMRSSLTCPLRANGIPVAFLFFSSIQPNAYADVHISIFKRIAEQVSVIVEKGKMISELAAQKAAIEEKNLELLNLDRLKNQFLGIAAHDLRSPLATVQTAMQILLVPSNDLTAQERETIMRDVLQQSEHMLALLDDLLDVTRIESGDLKLTPQKINVGTFLHEVVRRHSQLAAPKGTSIELTSVDEGYLTADLRRLRQVVDNLISNAIKYSPPSSHIQIQAHRLSGEWRIDVSDQGPGISVEDQKRLFQDFVRLSARPTGNEKSTGLGLAIARRIIEAHHGKIGVDSIVKEGSTFWITLPD